MTVTKGSIMPRLRLTLSISQDGYVAGPNQSVDNPLGVGGMCLHEWAFELKAFREAHGMDGGIENVSGDLLTKSMQNIGAGIMGRNMFGGHPGGWDADEPWNGWWGDNPPFHYPVFVLTHHARNPLTLEDTTFTFVTNGIESALEQAFAAAGGRDVHIGGGAETAQQYLAAGLVDEMILHQVPCLLGGGERLFEHVGGDLHGLKLADTVVGPGATHFMYSR
jgi:dihydrofolate reductase